jgi:4-phytase/acid phosphatase
MKKTSLLRLVICILFCASFLVAQATTGSSDDTQLKQVIIFGRHGVRAPLAPNAYLNTMSTRPFPMFSVPDGYLTNNGVTLETQLGGYYRLWLTQEGLLTGNDAADAATVYFRANTIERTIATAQAFAKGFLPAVSVNVNYFGPTTSDPLFDPVGAKVAEFNQNTAIAAVEGRLGNNPQLLSSALAPELALTRSALFNYSLGQTPVPATPQGKVDVNTVPITAAAATSTSLVNLGGFISIVVAVDPFVLQYAEGLPLSDVGWGQLSANDVSQTTRPSIVAYDLLYRTPYLDKVQSSNIASHVVRSMVQSATGDAMTGTLGNPSTKAIVLIASDVNITGLAGLFHLDWLLPTYQQNFCTPGGALVFELRQSLKTGEYVVRASYIAQTLDQLRNRTALTLAAPPAKAPVFIPGCSVHNATFDCPLAGFVALANQAIDPRSVDPNN